MDPSSDTGQGVPGNMVRFFGDEKLVKMGTFSESCGNSKRFCFWLQGTGHQSKNCKNCLKWCLKKHGILLQDLKYLLKRFAGTIYFFSYHDVTIGKLPNYQADNFERANDMHRVSELTSHRLLHANFQDFYS